MKLNQLNKIESSYRRGVHVPLIYIDIAGDLNAGILLSQLVYWSERAECIAKRRFDWYEEIRMTAKQYDRAARILIDQGLIEVENRRSKYYSGAVVPHVSIVQNVFEAKIGEILNEGADQEYDEDAQKTDRIDERSIRGLTKGQSGDYPKVNPGIDERSISTITETTTEITTERCSHQDVIDLCYAVHEYAVTGKEAKSAKEIEKLKPDKKMLARKIQLFQLDSWWRQKPLIPSTLLSSWNYLRDKAKPDSYKERAKRELEERRRKNGGRL